MTAIERSCFGEEVCEVVQCPVVSFRELHTQGGKKGESYARRPANDARGGKWKWTAIQK